MIRLADEENAIDEADAIAKKAIAGAASIARETTAKLIEAIRRSGGDLSDEIFETVFGASEAVGQALFDSQVAAFLGSGAEAAGPVLASAAPTVGALGRTPPANPLELIYRGDAAPRIRFPIIERAGKLLAEANVMEPADFYALSAEAKSQAFTISGGLAESTIEKVAGILDETFRETSSRTEFMRKIEDRIPTLPISEAHLEQVFRNNVNGAYSDGGEAVLSSPLVEDAFPFRAYYAIRDERVRKEHKRLEKFGLSGTNVFYHRDPVWKIFRPPWDWNCRCGWAPMTIRQAARLGVAEAVAWLDTGEPPADLFVPTPPFLPSSSWLRVGA